nr:DUF2188 domain-containing protein [Nevskia sp.]
MLIACAETTGDTRSDRACSERPAFHSTQREAVAAARDIARNQGTEMLIHGENGRIRERNTYGNDPFPPKG